MLAIVQVVILALIFIFGFSVLYIALGRKISGATRVIVSICIAIGLIPIFLISVLMLSLSIDNFKYARIFFNPELVEIKNVVASKRWHGETFGCTYAIVELSKKSNDYIKTLHSSELRRLARPVKNKRFEENISLRWPSKWRSTPNPSLSGFTEKDPPRTHCLNQIGKKQRDIIVNALKRGGGWYGFTRGSTSFVLPSVNLIGTYKYGG